MNALTKHEQPGLPGVPNEPITILDVISRAARDPDVDVNKLERLMAMSERLEAREADRVYSEAMLAAQKDMEPVRADANNTQTKSKYATFGALDTAIRPTYTKHGFTITHGTEDSPKEDHVRVVMFVRHVAGHKEKLHIDIPCDGKGAKGNDVMTKTHAVMSAITYGKRGNLGAAFNIVVTVDDDGNAAGGSGPINDDQLQTLSELIARFDADVPKFCAFFKIKTVVELPAKQYRQAVEMLNIKGRQK